MRSAKAGWAVPLKIFIAANMGRFLAAPGSRGNLKKRNAAGEVNLSRRIVY